MLKRSLLISFLLLIVTTPAMAFIVKHVEVTGNHRLSDNTVMNYLPIHVGDDVSGHETSEAIQSLYQTEFFSDVYFAQRGDTLIVHVTERPVVAGVRLSGNKIVPSKQLKSVLKEMGIEEGQVFKPEILSQAQKSLEHEYVSQGHYNVQVHATTIEETPGSVIVRIRVKEGNVAIIRDIKIIGAHHYSEKQLLNQLTMTTPSFMTIFNHAHHFSQKTFSEDMETLRSYYLDSGFAKFEVNSSKVSVTPDRKYVYIVIHITEGAQYHFKGFDIIGQTVVPDEDLRALVHIEEGAIFSREKTVDGMKAIGDYLGDHGHVLASIQPEPVVDDEAHTVFVKYRVSQGPRIYVRRILFEGNLKTQDHVLRRAMQQVEGGSISRADIESSKRQLRMMPYIEPDSIEINTNPVEGTQDQVDLNVKVKERPATSLHAGLGYSSANGLVLDAGFSQKNFFGTGNTFGIMFRNSDYDTLASIDYTNPFYTRDGVSRTFNLYAHRYNPDRVDISKYASDNYGAGVNYGFPLTQNNRFSVGANVSHTHLSIGGGAAAEVLAFVADNGNDFNELTLDTGFDHNSLDRFLLPTKGNIQRVSASVSMPLDSESLLYYTLNYNMHYFLPLEKSRQFIFTARGDLGYGNGRDGLPFFRNYYAGGMSVNPGQVKAYRSYSLGPRDSNDDPLGGNVLMDGGLGLIFPTPLNEHHVRTTAFFDVGNVYDGDNVDLGDLRLSAGVEVEWFLPMLGAPIQFMLGSPINKRKGDRGRYFDFSVGALL